MSPRRLLNILGVLVMVAALGFLVRHVVASWPAISAYPWQWRPGLLALSLVLAVAAYAILTRAWRTVLRAIDVRLHWTTAYWIFLISNLGRYLPGKFWQIGAAAWFGQTVGLRARDVAPSMIVYQLYLIPVGGLLAFTWGRYSALPDTPLLQGMLWLIVGISAAAAIWPHRLLAILRPLAVRVGVEPERWRLAVNRRLAIAVQCAAGWGLLALAFAVFARSLAPLAVSSIPELGRAFIAAYLVGFAVLLAPGGIGVREGALTLMLSVWMDPGPAAALALLSRLWATATELLALVPAVVWARRDRARGRLAGNSD